MRSAHEQLQAIAAVTARDRALIAAREGEAMETGDQFSALMETARALDEAGIPYALIGGIAVGIQAGSPRATVDIDIATPSDVAREVVRSAMESAGLVLRGEFEHSMNFRHASGEPVQFAFDPAFDAVIARAEAMAAGGGTIRVARKDDLIAMKERAARDPARRRSRALRDQADVELLRGDVPDPDEGW